MRRLALFLSFFVSSTACSSESTNNPNPGVDSSTTTETGGDAADTSIAPDAVSDSDAGDSGDSSVPEPETCAPTFDPCTAAAGTNKHVRVKGTVVTPDKLYCNGEVLFSTETGKIVCAGADCSTAPEAAAAQVVCANGVVFPGLIDPHQHADYNHMPVFKHTRKYDNRNTWRNHESLYDDFKIPHRPFGSTNQANQILAQRYAEMRIAFSGATSMSGTAGALLGNAGIAGWIRNVDSSNAAASGLPGGIYVDPDTDTIAVRTSDGSIDKTATASHVGPIVSKFGNANYRAFLPHIAEGIDVNARAEFDEADALGVIAGKTAVIHCTGCSTQQLRKMALAKTDLIWSPRSNLDLYGITANVTVAKRLGVKIALGVDWTPSGSMNPIGELQCARHLNDTWYNKTFTDRELVAMSTVNAAHAIGMEDQLGQLLPGYWADLAIVAGDRTSPYKALLDAKAEQIRMVTVGGRAIYGDPDALTGDVVAPMTCADVPNGFSPDGKTGVCGTAKKFCVDTSHAGIADQIKTILTTAKSSDAACNTSTPTGTHCYAYDLFPLFRCDATAELDRCAMGHPAIPRRASGGGNIPAVAGTPVPGTDDDGDGVANAMDNCPKVFNPPFDLNTSQDDADGDGIGDVCDDTPCTKSDGSDACVGDADGDGVKDDKDNCPAVKNADQVDTDSDMKGDACDACPNDSNPGTTPCPVPLLTIPEVRNPASTKRPAADASFRIEKVVITAVKSAGTNHAYVVQDPTATQWAGLYVFIGTAPATLAVGDEISASGKFAIFRGIEQINTTSGTVTKTGTATVPTPIVVTPAEIMTGGSKAKSHQSMLVQVLNVEAVTATSADVFKVAISATDTNQLTVTSFIANDLGTSPFPAVVGDKYSSITGVVYSFIATGMTDDSRLAPRSTADLVKTP